MGLKDATLVGAEAAAIGDDPDADTDVGALRTLAHRLDSVDDGDSGGNGNDDDASNGDAGAGGSDANGSGTDGGGDDDIPNVDQPFAVTHDVGDFSTYEADRAKLIDERAALRKQNREGEIDPDAYDDKLDDINERLNKLDTDYRLAQRDAAQNEKTAREQWFGTVATFKRTLAEAGGLDYDKNTAAATIWDSHVKALASNADNADKDAVWFLREAHRLTLNDIKALAGAAGMKLSDAGKTVKDAAVKAAVDARRPNTAGTKSLAGTPEASSADDGSKGGEFSHLAGLSGLALEKALAKMSPEQQAAYLEADA